MPRQNGRRDRLPASAVTAVERRQYQQRGRHGGRGEDTPPSQRASPTPGWCFRCIDPQQGDLAGVRLCCAGPARDGRITSCLTLYTYLIRHVYAVIQDVLRCATPCFWDHWDHGAQYARKLSPMVLTPLCRRMIKVQEVADVPGRDRRGCRARCPTGRS